MDLGGVVTGTVALAIAIKEFCHSLRSSWGDDRLVLQIKHDADILDSFAQIFGTVVQRPGIDESEKVLLGEICVGLRPLLERLQAWISKKERIKQPTASIADKVAHSLKSALWQRSDIRELAAELAAWTDRYYIRLGLLPPALKEKLLSGKLGLDLSAPKFQSHQAIRHLHQSFEYLRGAEPRPELDLSASGHGLPPSPAHSREFRSMDEKQVIVEYKQFTPSRTQSGPGVDPLSAAVKALVAVLNHAESNICRIPKCIGFVHQPDHNRYALIYEHPSTMSLNSAQDNRPKKPRTLLDLLKATRTSSSNPSKPEPLPPLHPLNQRFELARKLTCAVLYVHVMGWVHKSIRSSNIILFEDVDPGDPKSSFPYSLGHPFLCGFEAARQDRGSSDQQGDAYWDFNIYRHPARQGLLPQERYSMNHDIYSLGVVLLEMGLWKPLLNMTGLRELRRATTGPNAVKDYLVKLAEEKLAVAMGAKYAETVRFCLQIDGENAVGSTTALDAVLAKLEDMSLGLH